MHEEMDKYDYPWHHVKDFVDSTIKCIKMKNYGDAHTNLERLKLVVDVMATQEKGGSNG